MDIVGPEIRSRMMASIRGKNTRPELLVRRALHAAGFRHRLHDHKLPGKPDLVLRKWRAAIFVHGCFWHRHPGCRYATTPATNEDFWQRKFEDNVNRDRRSVQALHDLGWRVATVWECGLKAASRQDSLERLAAWLPDTSREAITLPSGG